MHYQTGDILPPQFRLETQLGVGGFSEVWRAIDEQARDAVAVKIFLKQDQEGIDLCREEYRRMTYLRHPNILQPRYFSSADGAPFIVMPLCEIGSTMNKVGEYSEKQLAQMIAQVGAALGHIHAMGQPILHNDIKPDNILEERSGSFVLADFGISEKLSRKLSQSIPEDDQRTQMMGQDRRAGITPMAYRAPELFAYTGRAKQQPSKATDVWAFGATLYQIASGELPFDNEGGLRQLTYHTANQQVMMEDILADLPAEYSSGLNQLLKRCMAFDPNDRPDAEDVADWARAYLKTGVWPVLPEIEAKAEPLPEPAGRDTVRLTPNKTKTPTEYDEVVKAGKIRVSTHSIEFGASPIGKTNTQRLDISGMEGLSGMAHVTVTAPFTASLPGQPLLTSFDLALTADGQPHTIEVHFEPSSTDHVGGELAVSHPKAEQQRVALHGSGSNKAFPVWIPATAVGAVMLGLLAYLFWPTTEPAQPSDRPVVDIKQDSPQVAPPIQPGPSNPDPTQTNKTVGSRKTTEPVDPNAPKPIVPEINVAFGFPSNAVTGQTVSFEDNSQSNVPVTERKWDFGDGGTSEQLAGPVTHTYKTPGKFQVSLCVNGKCQRKPIDVAPYVCNPEMDFSRNGAAGASSGDRCSMESARVWVDGGTITLNPKQNMQLKGAVVFADHPGKLNIRIKATDGDCDQNYPQNVAAGRNVLSFVKDFTLIAGKTYTLEVKTSPSKISDTPPKLENIAACNPTIGGAAQMGVNYSGKIFLLDLKYQY